MNEFTPRRFISSSICHFRQINMSDRAEVCHDAAPGRLMSRLGPDTRNSVFWEFSGGCPRLQMKGKISAARETQWSAGFDVWKVCEVAARQKATNLPPDWKRKLLEVEKVVRQRLCIFLFRENCLGFQNVIATRRTFLFIVVQPDVMQRSKQTKTNKSQKKQRKLCR